MKPVINSSEYESIIINSKEFKNHVVIYSSGEIIEANIRHELHRDFVEKYLKEDIELLIIGTGTSGCVKVFEGVKHLAEEKGIELIIDETPEACYQFNKSSKRAVALIHITC
jgi:hypothetical protein